jgi:hypothetical protein
MNKIELEKLINKPRAFKRSCMIKGKLPRLRMILLGSEYPSNYFQNKNYYKVKENRVCKNNDLLF